MIDLKNKVAIVTGGGRGLGKAMCIKLAQAGASVVVSDMNESDGAQVVKEIEAANGQAIYVNANVTKEAEVNHLVAMTVEKFGGLDILVNNAGISLTMPYLETSELDFQKIIDVNIKGVYFGCKAAIPELIKRSGGKIVNISSMAGKEGVGLLALYSTSKFAVIGLTQSLAKEFAGFNINVNAVCPGIIKTKMWTDEIMKHGSEVLGVPGEVIWDTYTAEIPLKRPQSEESIADMVVFLSSEMASEITGQSINVNGGRVMH